MVSTAMNLTQLHLLRMSSYNKNEDSLSELKDVLFHYYCQKVGEEGKRVWKEKNMSNELMHKLLNSFQRQAFQYSEKN